MVTRGPDGLPSPSSCVLQASELPGEPLQYVSHSSAALQKPLSQLLLALLRLGRPLHNGATWNHTRPLHTLQTLPRQVCALCLFFLALLQRSVSDVTHKHSFVCSWWIMSVYKMRLTNASGLQLDVYEHTVSLRKDLVCGRRFPTVWRLITSHQTG